MRDPHQIIKTLRVTEKGSAQSEKSNQYTLEVASAANKIEIKHAVEKLWNVNVLKVRTAIVRGKQKRVGRYIGRRPNWKRALVTLAPGQKIEFFEGV